MHKAWSRTVSTLVILLALCGCRQTPPSTPGSNATPVPAIEPTRPNSPTTRVGTSVDLSVFAAALRPEFAADLYGMEEITRYDLELVLDMAKLQLTGRQVVHYTNHEQIPLDALYLRLLANYPGCLGSTSVAKVESGGRPLEAIYEVDRTALRVPLTPPLAPGGKLELALEFEVKIPLDDDCRHADFTYSEGVLSLAHVYPQVAVYDEAGWQIGLPGEYGDLVYADAALYEVTMTLPADWVVAASGTEIARTTNPDGTVTRSWVTGPARDFDLVLSPDYLTLSEEVEGIRVTSFYLPDHRLTGQRALNYAVQALKVFEARFGPYRYNELDLAETPTAAGGIEYPGLIVLNTWFYEEEMTVLETVVAHEVAHQWWYNLIGSDQINEPWLDEGLASYVSVTYYEDTRRQEYGQTLLDFYQADYQEVISDGLDLPANLPTAAYDLKTYGPIVYSKAALFFDAVHRQVGDADFRHILHRYYHRFLYGLARGEDLLSLAAEVSGKDLDPLYQTWILGTREPPPTPVDLP